jgi:hypothetical protein
MHYQCTYVHYSAELTINLHNEGHKGLQLCITCALQYCCTPNVITNEY